MFDIDLDEQQGIGRTSHSETQQRAEAIPGHLTSSISSS